MELIMVQPKNVQLRTTFVFTLKIVSFTQKARLLAFYSIIHIITDTGDHVTIIRRCEPKNIFGVHCKYMTEGDVSSIVCTCDSNNCNKDDQCTCGEPTPTSTSSTPTTTSANYSSNIGPSFMLIASILMVLLGNWNAVICQL